MHWPTPNSRFSKLLKREFNLNLNIQRTTKQLILQWSVFLEKAGKIAAKNGQQVVLLIDGVNQMNATGGAHAMEWYPMFVDGILNSALSRLPVKLPYGVKMVISVLEKERGVLDAIRNRLPQASYQSVKPLPESERCEFVCLPRC